MSIPANILRQIADAGGSMEKARLRELMEPSAISLSQRISDLIRDGLLVAEFRVTDAGMEYLRKFKPRKKSLKPKPSLRPKRMPCWIPPDEPPPPNKFALQEQWALIARESESALDLVQQCGIEAPPTKK